MIDAREVKYIQVIRSCSQKVDVNMEGVVGFSVLKSSKQRRDFCCILNELTSVFYASVLLLIMNFVITLSK